MKLLLDEQVPKRLAGEFPDGYDVHTVQEMGWASEQNGKLLALAADKNFDALITADKNMEYQQSEEYLPIKVIVMAPLLNRYTDLVPLVPSVLKVLRMNDKRKFYRVDA